MQNINPLFIWVLRGSRTNTKINKGTYFMLYLLILVLLCNITRQRIYYTCKHNFILPLTIYFKDAWIMYCCTVEKQGKFTLYIRHISLQELLLILLREIYVLPYIHVINISLCIYYYR